MVDLITKIIVPLLGEIIREAPELIDAIIDKDENAEERLAHWVRTSQNNKAAEARWWASRAAQALAEGDAQKG